MEQWDGMTRLSLSEALAEAGANEDRAENQPHSTTDDTRAEGGAAAEASTPSSLQGGQGEVVTTTTTASTPNISFGSSLGHEIPRFEYGSPDSGANRSMELDDVLDFLDALERQVESLREKCTQLQGQQKSLLQTLSTVASSVNESSSLKPVDKMDCVTTTNRLKSRLQAVKLDIAIVRDAQQAQSLDAVQKMIDQLIRQLEQGGDRKVVMDTAGLYKHACAEGGTGSKFESLLVSCTSHDQKELKARVAQLVSLIETTLAGEI